MSFVEPTDGTRIVKEGIGKVHLTLSGSCLPGDALGYDDGWYQCNSNSSADLAEYADFVAGESGVSGDIITAYREALLDFGSGCTADLGDKLYLSDVTSGDYTSNSALCSARGHVVGFMTTAREGWIMPTYHGFGSNHISLTQAVETEDWNAFEIRSQNDATTTGEGKCASFSCRLGGDCGAASLTGVKVSTYAKGTGACEITTRMSCLHLELEGDDGSRTFTGETAFIYCKNRMPSGTYSDKFCVIYVDTQGKGKAMDGFLQVAATGEAGVVVGADGMNDDPDTASEAGYLKIYVGTTEYQIPIYNSA